MTLWCNVVSYWLGAYTKWSLHMTLSQYDYPLICYTQKFIHNTKTGMNRCCLSCYNHGTLVSYCLTNWWLTWCRQTCSRTFSWRKIFTIWYKFTLSLVPKGWIISKSRQFQLMKEVMTWTKNDPLHWYQLIQAWWPIHASQQSMLKQPGLSVSICNLIF